MGDARWCDHRQRRRAVGDFLVKFGLTNVDTDADNHVVAIALAKDSRDLLAVHEHIIRPLELHVFRLASQVLIPDHQP